MTAAGHLARQGAQLCRATLRGEAGPREVLDLLHDHFGDMASLSEIDPRVKRGEVLSRGRPAISSEEEALWERLLPRHPYWQHVLTRPDHAPRLTDVVDIRAFTGSEVYCDLLRPWGARYHAAVILERSPRALTVLSLWRHRRDFSDAEVAVFQPLARSFAAATAYRSALEQLEQLEGLPGEPVRRPTPRQRQVVELVALGLTNQQVASRLAMSPRTVRKHLESLFALSGARSRTQLAVWWREDRTPPVTATER